MVSTAGTVKPIVATELEFYLLDANTTRSAYLTDGALDLVVTASDRDDLEQQNEQLRAEIAALRSVPRLIDEAQDLGFHNAKQDEVDYIVVEEVPAALGAPPR